jgi:hypothetical protein
MVDDPLSGRDISAGTYRVDDIQLAFSRAARRLESLAKGGRSAGTNYLQVRGRRTFIACFHFKQTSRRMNFAVSHTFTLRRLPLQPTLSIGPVRGGGCPAPLLPRAARPAL